MSGGRNDLLIALMAHNRRIGIDVPVWGEGAAEAARLALERTGAAPPVSIGQAAATAYRLETPLDLRYDVRCDAPQRLHFPVRGGSAEGETSPKVLEVALLRDGLVREWMGYHLLMRGAEIVSDGSSAYWPLAGGLLSAGGVPAPLPPQRQESLEEAFVVCDDLDTTNFCHFICDLLPKIALAGECRRGIPIVIEPPRLPFQQQLLARVSERFGHPIVALAPGMALAVRRLFYLRRSGHTHPLLRCSGLAIGWVRQLLDARPAPPPPGSLLYLGRRSRRRVLGEEALLTALARISPRLQVVHDLGRLPVREQAELVCGHAAVVGPHGAGFTHLLFAGEGPRLALELMAEGNGSLAYALIAHRLRIDHRIHVAENVASGQGDNHPDLRVNPEAVLELLRPEYGEGSVLAEGSTGVHR